MARPRNEELYNAIKQEAYRQFLQQGYVDTTYQSIATACDVTRIAVQNYFPTKLDLALAFFDETLRILDTVITEAGFHRENEFDSMFCIGQGFFSFLMKDAGSRKLLLDLISNRELTSEILQFEYRWGQGFITAKRTVPEAKFQDDVIVSMGGFYELLYMYLKNGTAFDLATHLGRVVRTIMHDCGYSYEEAKLFVATHAITEAEREQIVSSVSNSLTYLHTK